MIQLLTRNEGDKGIGTSGKKVRRFNDYMDHLLETRKKEVIKEDIINEFNIRNGQGLTSPTTLTTTEETRMLMEYMDRANLFHIAKRDEKRGKVLTLRKFFKSKRNQQVEVYSKCGTEPVYTEGKVSTIGRDFVMLTNLKERIWIPYSAIESANIPYGIPNYSNTHQNYIYDNNLRNKLLYNLGETVSKREALKQLFFEETLQTNLNSWRDTWVEIHLDDDDKKIGRIIESKDKKLTLRFFGRIEDIEIKQVKFVGTVRVLSVFSHIMKTLTNTRKQE